MDFEKSETDEERAVILRALLLYIAKRLGLETKAGKLINIKFEKLPYNFVGFFFEKDTESVRLDTCYTRQGASIQEAIGTYLHECAHFIIYNFAHYKTQHCCLFFAVNLAITIKADAFIKSVSCLDYDWTRTTLRIYNIYEDQGYIDPALIDGEDFSKRIGEATRLAFKYAQNSNNSVYFICGQICGYYSRKRIREFKAKRKAERFKELSGIVLIRLSVVAVLVVCLKMIF